jgi:hypothetical protein
MSKPKNRGKELARVFLDVFSLPENESGVHFPEKNLDLPLENLSFFAVRHCTITGEALKCDRYPWGLSVVTTSPYRSRTESGRTSSPHSRADSDTYTVAQGCATGDHHP